jgi:tetratricopeptide (TPR) repeat protein
MSSPSQAEVYVASLGDRKSKLVGETPIKMTAADLSKTYGGAGPVSLEFKKDGYTTVKTIITDLGAADLMINMELPPSSGLEDQVRLNSVIDSIFESQRLAKVGREDDALSKLRALEKEAPHLAATYELEGGIYYLQKKYRQALDAYTLASNYNPKNPQVVRMRNYLEISLGVRKKEISNPGPSDQIPENNLPESNDVTTERSAVPPKKGGR